MDYRNEVQSKVAKMVADRIASQLDDGRSVLWLLSGGSGGQVCVDASKLLTGRNISNLYVTFSDERYGEPGHADENYQILVSNGLSLPGAQIYRPLQGLSRDETVVNFADWLGEVSERVDYKFAVMGVGEDGHTAGIKPHSPAVDSQRLAEIYHAADFDRLTVTLNFLRTLDEAVVQIYGAPKHDVVSRLLENKVDTEDFPALVLHDIAQVTLFSDYQR